MPSADDLILHQYDISPFSEKARRMLGLKGLSWFACNQPVIMPKRDLIALTGGYRQIPVLQIGADVWCGTELIADELERRFPSPSLYPYSGAGLGRALSYWTDQTLFMLVVQLLFGSGDFPVDEAFIADRSALIGAPFDIKAMGTMVEANLLSLRAHLDLPERQLADGRAFLLGSQADMADINLFHVVDFMRLGRGKIAAVLADFPALVAWEKRVGAIGHGSRENVDPVTALNVALAATPAPPPPSVGSEAGRLGARAKVVFGAASSEDAEGELVSIARRRVSLRRHHPAVGEVITHYPRDAGRLVIEG